MTSVFAPAIIIRAPKISFNGTTLFFSVSIMDTKSNTSSPKNFRVITLNTGEYALGNRPKVHLEKEISFPAHVVYNKQTQAFDIRISFTPKHINPGTIVPFILLMTNAYGQELCFEPEDPTRKFKITDKLHPVFEVRT